jgi:hypothetical protein
VEADELFNKKICHKQTKHQKKRKKPTVVDRLTASIDELIYAFENKIPITNMLGDATHRSPHIDEISCISAFRETSQGQKMFPNCGTEILLATEIEFEKRGYDGQDGFFKALKDGYRMLGTCGGAFDEHYMDPKTRRSSFQLVYDYLELGKDALTKIQFQAMLNYINQEDRRGALLKKINLAENDHASKNCLNVLNAFGEIPGLLKDGMLAHQFDSESQIELINAMLVLLKGKLTNQAKYAAGYHQLCESTFRFVSLDFLPPVFDKKQQELKRNAVIIMSNEKTTAYISKHAHQYFRNQHPDKHIDIFIYINGQNQVQIMPAPGTDPKVVMIQELVPIMRANIAQLMEETIPQWNDLRTEHDPLRLLFFP